MALIAWYSLAAICGFCIGFCVKDVLQTGRELRSVRAGISETEAEISALDAAIAAYPGLACKPSTHFKGPVTGELKRVTGFYLSEPKDKQ